MPKSACSNPSLSATLYFLLLRVSRATVSDLEKAGFSETVIQGNTLDLVSILHQRVGRHRDIINVLMWLFCGFLNFQWPATAEGIRP